MAENLDEHRQYQIKLLESLLRSVEGITANLGEVKERIIRLEALGFETRIEKLQEDVTKFHVTAQNKMDENSRRLTVLETRGQMLSATAGIIAGAVSSIAVGLILFFLKGS